jgi:hypothetical protein
MKHNESKNKLIIKVLLIIIFNIWCMTFVFGQNYRTYNREQHRNAELIMQKIFFLL